MNKERLVSFTDAVLAIIMTILVLQLPEPAAPTFSALWGLQEGFFAYALSFFWLGALWFGMHGIWDVAKKISNKVIGLNIILLFFASLIPYTTKLVSEHFDSSLMQGIYGIIVVLVTMTNIALHKAIDEPNSDNEELLRLSEQFRMSLIVDVIIKLVGLILALTIYPRAMMMSVLTAATYTTFVRIASGIKKKNKKATKK